MKAQWLATIALIVTCLVSSPASCLAGSQCQPGVVVKFGNGVWNDEDAAQSTRRLLERRLETKISGTDLEGLVEYDLSFNPSAGALLDLLETYGQNRRTDWTQFWRYLAALDLMPDFLQDKIQDMASTVDAAAIQANPAVQKHIANYNALLSEGSKVVLVAHSQGNLFANIAYPGIGPEYIDGFGIVSVGNPDNYVADDGLYTTLTEDIVIGIVPFSLPANVNNFFGINWHDWSGHKFADSYMAPGRKAEAKILDDTVETINILTAFESGPRPCAQGILAISISGSYYTGANPTASGSPAHGGWLIWDSYSNAPLQVPKSGGGYWDNPVSDADYRGDFFHIGDWWTDFKAAFGASADNSLLSSRFYSSSPIFAEDGGPVVLPGHSDPATGYSGLDGTGYRSQGDFWRVDTSYISAKSYIEGPAGEADCLAQLAARNEPWTSSDEYPLTSGSAVNAGGSLDSWTEEWHRTNIEHLVADPEMIGWTGPDSDPPYWYGYYSHCPQEAFAADIVGGGSLSFSAPIGGVPNYGDHIGRGEWFYGTYYVGFKLSFGAQQTPFPADSNTVKLIAAGAGYKIYGPAITWSGSESLSQTYHFKLNCTGDSPETVSFNNSMSGSGTFIFASGLSVNIAASFAEAGAFENTYSSVNHMWPADYNPTKSVDYAISDVAYSQGYDPDDNLQLLIVLENQEYGQVETSFSPPPKPWGWSTYTPVESEPTVNSRTVNYEILTVRSALVEDAGVDNPFDLPENSGLTAEIQSLINAFLTDNPATGYARWRLEPVVEIIKRGSGSR